MILEAWYRPHKEMLITGELYHQLRASGIDCCMETIFPSDIHKSGEFRVDICVFRDGLPAVVVEVKREGKRLKSSTRQAKAYRGLMNRFGVRPLFINSAQDIQKTIESIKEVIGAR